jgi:hypothetical protein
VQRSQRGLLLHTTQGERTNSMPDRNEQHLRRSEDELPFFPQSLIGLKNSYGRRWAVMQSLAYGGTVSDILERAGAFDRRRVAELGVKPARNIQKDRPFLRGAEDFYPKALSDAGWTVLQWGERWVVEAPTQQ